MHPRFSSSNVTKLLIDRQCDDIEIALRRRLQASPAFVRRFELEALLEGHNGCVNCLEWSSNGRLLASSSDDLRVILWDPFRRRQVLDFKTPHHGNIFSVKFLPGNESMIATGAADSAIYLYDVNAGTETTPFWKCECHDTRVKRLATAADAPFLLWSAAEDGRIFQFDTREKHTCHESDPIELINLQNHIGQNAEAKCVAINQRRSEMLAVGANDAYARLYDRRMLKVRPIDSIERSKDTVHDDCVTYYCPGHLNKIKEQRQDFSSKAITYLSFSPNGDELLVNMGVEHIYLYDINNAKRPVYLNMPQFNKTTESNSETENNERMLSTNAFDRTAKLPEDVEAMKIAGNDLLENEKYLQAIYQYTMAIQRIPNHPVFYLNRATALIRRDWYGDIYAGLRDCQMALQLDPTYLKAHFRLTRALFQLGYVSEASECLHELQNRFPNQAKHKGVELLSKDIQMEQTKSASATPESSHVESELSANELRWRATAFDYDERFIGHSNTTTDIKEATFFGNDGKYVIAGSDEGNFFIWERPTNMIKSIFKGDSSIVNCIQPHPFICMLATSGIDNEIRIWSPQSDDESFESKNRTEDFDTVVVQNQHRMQADPYDFRAPGTICRSS